ncbi:protein MAIN-LIKE 2-like [Arachis stenosperma]|uniref:protein MAIN-LIKE 2-like n=1 Tax=Arachis stenosperma TaxID=217475 RepID=UPI0025AB86E7|nr:protein MAIN-LIKE 2-like [Arachis stenosperma]
MPLHDRIILYLEKAGLYHLARLNTRWFWLDEPLVSALIERWRPEMHTFHMPFGECIIALQDVAYQLRFPVDGLLVSGCLTDFEKLTEDGRPAWEWFQELFGELPPPNKVKQFTLFGDKSGNRVHIWWLPFVVRLDDMGSYSWASHLYRNRFICPHQWKYPGTNDMVIKLSMVAGNRRRQASVRSVVPSNLLSTLRLSKCDANQPRAAIPKLFASPMKL